MADLDISDLPPMMPPTTPVSSSGERLTLQVGKRTFITTRDTLSGSLYFSVLFARWNEYPPLDGIYYIDRDGDLFAHVLHYLRSLHLPIFWEPRNGHDRLLYHQLLGEARYFNIPKLVEWLRGKKIHWIGRDFSEQVRVNSLWVLQ